MPLIVKTSDFKGNAECVCITWKRDLVCECVSVFTYARLRRVN